MRTQVDREAPEEGQTRGDMCRMMRMMMMVMMMMMMMMMMMVMVMVMMMMMRRRIDQHGDEADEEADGGVTVGRRLAHARVLEGQARLVEDLHEAHL
jgi:flagellar basal body-associated protein FliL